MSLKSWLYTDSVTVSQGGSVERLLDEKLVVFISDRTRGEIMKQNLRTLGDLGGKKFGPEVEGKSLV